jgi:acyl-CoA thioesterase
MENIVKFLNDDKFAEHNGIELLEVSEGRARAKMDIKSQHLNGARVVHGGAIFTLADFAFAAASNSHGTIALAINANISFVKAVTEGILFAEAREISLNPKLATYTINITNEKNDLIAIFQGMVYRKKDSLDQRKRELL